MNSIKQDGLLYPIVIVHYLLAASCFTVLAAMLFFSVDTLSGHYFQPKLLALTHMAALGWGTLIIFGASYQLLPVVLETGLFSHKLAWFSFSFFISGLVLLVYTFWIFDPGIYMQAGGIFLLTGILLFGINIYLTGRRSKKKDAIEQEFILTACIWLLCTAILGVLLIFNFRYAFLPKDHLQFLKLHAHMGIAGWFLLLTIGVSAKLLPMFLVSSKPARKFLNLSYYLINGALILFLLDTYRYGINIKTYFILLAGAAGVVSYLIFVRSCFTSRIRKAVDPPILNTMLAFVLLAAGLIAAPFIIFYHLKNDALALRFTALYGTLLFMGWLSALILGQTFKTLPFIVWVKRYQHLAGKLKTPLPADLYKKTLLKVQSGAFVVFCLMFFPGLIAASPFFIKLGLLAFLIAAWGYFFNVLSVVLHKVKNPDHDKL